MHLIHTLIRALITLLLQINMPSVLANVLQVVSRIAPRHFSQCSILLAASASPENRDFYNFFKYHQFYLSKKLTTWYIVDISSMEQFKGSTDHSRRFTSYCKLVIVSLFSSIEFPLAPLLTLLTPLWMPITKRNADHYIFLDENFEKGSTESKRRATNFLMQEEISHQLKFKLFTSSAGDDAVKMFTHCIFCAGYQEQIIEIDASDSELELTKLFPDFTKNLYGYQLKIVGPTTYTSVFQLERNPSDNKFQMKRGLYTDIFRNIQKRLNYTYTFHPCHAFGNVKEGKTGVLMEDGQWAGCVGDLLRKTADFAIATSAVDQDRFSVIEYLTPICYNYIMFFTQAPRVAYTWRTIFRVFDRSTWTLVLLTGVILSITFYMLESKRISLNFLLLHFYGNLVGQPIWIGKPESLSSEITFVVWSFYAMVIGTAYGCVLKPLIAFPGIVRVPETIAALVQNSEWGWGASADFRSGIGEEVFKRSPNPMIRRIFKGLQDDSSIEECLRRAVVSNYACFHWDVMAGFTMNTEFVARRGRRYPFRFSKNSVMFLPRTWSTRKREIYQETINFVSGWSFDTGLWSKMVKIDAAAVRKEMLDSVDNGRRKPLLGTELMASDLEPRFATKEKPARPLRVEQVKAGFVALMSGAFLAGLAYSAEKFIYFYHKTKCKSTARKRNQIFISTSL